MIKNILIEKITNKLDFYFVDRYNEINDLKTIINNYIEDLGLTYNYDYNVLCKEIRNNTIDYINEIDYDDIEIDDIALFIYSIITQMIKIKILSSNLLDNKKTEILIKHNLNYHKLNKNKL